MAPPPGPAKSPGPARARHHRCLLWVRPRPGRSSVPAPSRAQGAQVSLGRLAGSTGSDVTDNLLEIVPISDRIEVGFGLEVNAITEAVGDGGPEGLDRLDLERLLTLGLIP